MEELVHYLENSPKSKRTSRWKKILECLPAPLSSALRPEDWKEIYSTKAINAALAKVRMVGFNEKIVMSNKTSQNHDAINKKLIFRMYVVL